MRSVYALGGGRGDRRAPRPSHRTPALLGAAAPSAEAEADPQEAEPQGAEAEPQDAEAEGADAEESRTRAW